MHNTINFVVVSVIMERFRRYSPEAFINECFRNHSEQHRAHLLSKFPVNGNVLEMLPNLDIPHIQEVNKFLNGLLPDGERPHYDSYI